MIRISQVMQFGILLLTLAAAFVANAEEPDAEQRFESASSAFKRGDVVVAMGLLETAIESDHAPSLALLAHILDKSGEYERAVELYRRAANQGNALGEFGLAGMYASGDGVERDHAKAVHWFRLAAEHEHGPAIVTLADAYEKGKLSLQPDLEASTRWLERGAALIYEPARRALEARRSASSPEKAANDE